MRMLHLYAREGMDPGAHQGFRLLLEVSSGRKRAELLHVPTLEHWSMDIQEIERQLRAGTARVEPIPRGTLGALRDRARDAERYGQRYSKRLVAEALEQLRAPRLL